MKKTINALPAFRVLLAAIAVLCIALPVFAALSSKSLSNDIAYYRKTAQAKNLNANDRRYILATLEEKYYASGVDLSPLKKELQNVDKKPAAARTTAPGGGSVEKLYVSETPADSRIVITARGVRRSNYFLLRDPDPSESPKIVLDLYGVNDKLMEKAKDIRVKNGLFARVQAGQFEGSPNNIVRIVADLREDRPYKVKNHNNEWVIAAEKKAAPPADDKAPAAPVKAPAPIAASAAAPAASVSAPAPSASTDSTVKYHIEAGDVLAISVYPAEELSRESIVQQDGKIPFPLVGSQDAKGLTPDQLAEALSKSLGKYISNPQVTVTVRQFSRRQIFITGEVRSVGAYNYKDNLRLMEFISSVGGFTNEANRREVRIYRGPPTKRQTHLVNVEEIISSGDFSKDFLLEPRDIIEVAKGRARIAILGDVRSPGYYEYKDNMQLLELISQAGGFNDTAQLGKINVIRPDGASQQKVFKVDLKRTLSGAQKDTIMAAGDTVYIPKKDIASANWLVSNVLPWLSLISLILVIRTGI